MVTAVRHHHGHRSSAHVYSSTGSVVHVVLALHVLVVVVFILLVFKVVVLVLPIK